ncbi:50S ribosomal protein L11 [archaeon]|nr:50S ribosomal protein L11 [archaeon]
MRAEIRVLVPAGKVTPANLGQAVGMAGLNIGKVVADINNATKKYEGMKMPVTISYDVKTKKYEIIVSLPPTSQLLLKAAGVSKAVAPDDEAPAADLTLEQVVGVVKEKSEVFKNLKKGVLQVLGTCVSMGFTVDGKDPREVQEEVRSGEHDSKLS